MEKEVTTITFGNPCLDLLNFLRKKFDANFFSFYFSRSRSERRNKSSEMKAQIWWIVTFVVFSCGKNSTNLGDIIPQETNRIKGLYLLS